MLYHLLPLKGLVTVVTNQNPREFLQNAQARFDKAKRRVGTSDLEQLRWLLEFLQSKADHQAQSSEDKQQQLKFDLAYLTGWPDPYQLPPHEEIVRLANEVTTNIRELIRTSRWTLRLPGTAELTRTIRPRAVTRAEGLVLDGFASYYGSDDFRSAFLLRVADVVEAEGTRIRTCAQNECQRLFARHGRAKYCSSRCSQRERDSRFRQRRPKIELSKRRHRYYKNRIAKQRGRATADKVRPRSR